MLRWTWRFFGDDKINGKDATQVSKTIVRAIMMKDTDSHKEKCKKIVNVMNCMTMKKREKGTTEGVQKFNTFLGRWFSQAKQVTQDKGEGCWLEMGALVHLKRGTRG